MKKSFFFLLFWTGTCVHAERLPETIIRIGLLSKVPSVTIGSEGAFEAVELSTGRRVELSERNMYLVKAQGPEILVGPDRFRHQVRFIARRPKKLLRVNGRRYRGSLVLAAGSSRLTVINETGLEGYLYGVLPREVSPSWPMESLKAQAVVARTFALKSLGKHQSSGYDVSADVWSQVYGGFESEKEPTNRAVDDTRSEVVTYKGQLINAVFFSSCGGRTEDPQDAWGSALPYMRSVRCSFCRKYSGYHWERQVSEAKVLSGLRKIGVAGTKVKNLRIAAWNRSGRAQFIEVATDRTRTRVRSSQFRVAVGPDAVRSTFLTGIRKTRDGFEFRGKGWGHGVGFCQWGAKGMAERRKRYADIATYYYPGTKVEEWEP